MDCRNPEAKEGKAQLLSALYRDHYGSYTVFHIHVPYRGRKEPLQALPSLRTVRAVFPHTALQLIVSSSGSTRFRMGFIHCEKSRAREVGICPVLMA